MDRIETKIFKLLHWDFQAVPGIAEISPVVLCGTYKGEFVGIWQLFCSIWHLSFNKSKNRWSIEMVKRYFDKINDELSTKWLTWIFEVFREDP